MEGGKAEGLVAGDLVAAGAVVGGDKLEGLFELVRFHGDLDADVWRESGDRKPDLGGIRANLASVASESGDLTSTYGGGQLSKYSQSRLLVESGCRSGQPSSRSRDMHCPRE